MGRSRDNKEEKGVGMGRRRDGGEGGGEEDEKGHHI